MFLFAQNITTNVQHELKSVPKRAALKVASLLQESPPWQLTFTGPQLDEWQDTWEPLPISGERWLLRQEQRGLSTADWLCTVKPIIVGPLRGHAETNIMKGGIKT